VLYWARTSRVFQLPIRMMALEVRNTLNFAYQKGWDPSS
jgi:hypothetical protein